MGITVHEDMDACPSLAYDTARRAVSAALAKASESTSSVYALAAAESEGWLLLLPDAFPLYRSSWRIPAQWQGRDTGRRLTPKEDLEAELAGPRFRESDGPEIVSKALAAGLLASPNGSNRSYSEFVEDLAQWEVPRRPSR